MMPKFSQLLLKQVTISEAFMYGLTVYSFGAPVKDAILAALRSLLD